MVKKNEFGDEDGLNLCFYGGKMVEMRKIMDGS